MYIKNEDDEPINSSQQQSQTILNSTSQIKKRKYHEEIGKNMIGMVRSIYENNTKRDEYSIFGEDIANSIRKLNTPYARKTIKYKIQTLLYNASLGYNDQPLTNMDIHTPTNSYNNLNTMEMPVGIPPHDF